MIINSPQLNNRRLISMELIERAKKRVAYKKPVAWIFPHAAEREYARKLKRIFEGWFVEVEKIIDQYLAAIVAEHEFTTKQDEFTDNIKAITSSIRGIQFSVFSVAARSLIMSTAKKVDVWNKRQFDRVIHSVTGLNIAVTEMWKAGTVNAFVEENVSLITNLNEQLAHRIEQTIYNGVSTGKRVESIRKEIVGSGIDQGVFGSIKKRAEFIARDQVGKLNGRMVEKRQVSIGIKNYYWRTSMDERVRVSHRSLEGKHLSWSHPPEEGHPGQPIMCRCYAEPDLKEFIRNL